VHARSQIHIIAEAMLSPLSLQQTLTRQRDIGHQLQTPIETWAEIEAAHLFGLLDASLHAVQLTLMTHILNAVLELEREDRRFQFGPIIVP
jgi:hypothetical protein